jgi:hypothetical protein
VPAVPVDGFSETVLISCQTLRRTRAYDVFFPMFLPTCF